MSYRRAPTRHEALVVYIGLVVDARPGVEIMKTVEVTGDSAQLRIIRAAANLFHKQGIHQTSPDEIIEASGTGKGQFYHYFKSKEGLVHAVMQFYLDAIESGKSPVNFNVNSWDELQEWFNRHVEMQEMFEMTRACPIGTI